MVVKADQIVALEVEQSIAQNSEARQRLPDGRLDSLEIREPFEPSYVDNAVLRGLRALPLRVVRA